MNGFLFFYNSFRDEQLGSKTCATYSFFEKISKTYGIFLKFIRVRGRRPEKILAKW